MADEAPLLLDVTRLIWRRWAGGRPTGIDRVCLAYLDHFGSAAQAVIQHPRLRRIMDGRSSAELFHLLTEPGTRFRRAIAGRLLRSALGHARPRTGAGRLYLNIGHTGLDGPGFAAWTRAADVRPIYLVHDLIPITHPQHCRAGEAERHRGRMRTVLKTATGIIGNSHDTLRALETFRSAEGLPTTSPTLAAWLGSTPLPRPAAPTAPERPTFVTLGTIEGRKNHLLLLEVWQRLVARLGNAAPRLLIIGRRGWEAEAVFNLLDRNEALRGHVVELHGCSDAALGEHLASARALLFPSLAEGFGLPLVEAMGIGTPVIASDIGALREIGGNIPVYLDPTDPVAWERAITDYADASSTSRADQLARLSDYHPPSWADHFRAVENWLATL